MSDSREIARLRWRCRRGMRELDVLLARFLDTCPDGLGDARPAFERLLELPDPALMECLVLGRAPPPGLEDIVERIRADARAPAA
jgi:antitoxin CptB